MNMLMLPLKVIGSFFSSCNALLFCETSHFTGNIKTVNTAVRGSVLQGNVVVEARDLDGQFTIACINMINIK